MKSVIQGCILDVMKRPRCEFVFGGGDVMHGDLLLLIVFLDLLLLERENKFKNFLRVGRGSEYLHRIVFQDLDPSLDVCGVLAWIMANTEFFANEHRRDLRS